MEYIAEYSDEIKNVNFVEQGTLCDSAVMDQSFDIHAVNNWEGQPDAIVRISYMTPPPRNNLQLDELYQAQEED